MATNGLVVMTPTSIAYSGTSASINADGSVDFSAVTSLSLNGVFTSNYDNYMVVIRSVRSAGSEQILLRMRASGVDESSASNYYTAQRLLATSTSVSSLRESRSYTRLGDSSVTARSGHSLNLYGPYLAQPTAGRSVVVSGELSAIIDNIAFTHSLSTSYDGFTIYLAADDLSGLVTVFAYNQ